MIFEIVLYILIFLTTIFFTKAWIRMAKSFNLVGRDANKYEKREVAESGGIAVITTFSIALLFYIFLKTYILHTETHIIQVFALLVSLLLAGFVGFVDDILGWKKGLKQWQKPLLTIPIAIPLVVINAGNSVMNLPFIGPVDLSWLYPLVILPIGIIGATNAFNILAGLNGLEALMGTVILSTLGVVSYMQGTVWLSVIIFSMVACLLGFLTFNKYPSKIFPGDSLTYSVGAFIAIVAILGNMEKLALFLFIPYYIEFVLKARSKFKAESFGKPQKNGALLRPYKKIYSLTHVFMGPKSTEKKVVLYLVLIEVIICILSVIFVV